MQRAMSPNGGGGGDTDDNPLSTYETELSALHDSIGQLVQVMLTDSVNGVKQVWMACTLKQERSPKIVLDEQHFLLNSFPFVAVCSWGYLATRTELNRK